MLRPTILCLSLGLAVLGGAACHSTKVSNERGESLRLVAPANQTVKRGDTNGVLVAIHRGNVAGPIALKFDQLPAGVEIVERDAKIAAGEETARITLYAKPDADMVSGHAVRVTATIPDGASVSEWFHVSVKAN